MRTVSIILALLLCFNGGAATVYFDIADFTTVPSAYRTLKITPATMPSVSGTNIIVKDSRSQITTGYGRVSFTNVVAGTYDVAFTGPNATTSFQITVTNSSATINAKDIISVETNSVYGRNAYSMASSDARYIQSIYTNGVSVGTNPLVNLIVGAGIELLGTNNPTEGRTDIRLSTTGGGGGGEANTLSSLGTGWALPTTKSLVDLRVNSITNDTSLSSVSNNNTITFSRAALTGAITAAAGANATFLADGAVRNTNVASGISATKIGDGSVDDSEWTFLDGITSGVQGQLNGKQAGSGALTNLSNTRAITNASSGFGVLSSDILYPAETVTLTNVVAAWARVTGGFTNNTTARFNLLYSEDGTAGTPAYSFNSDTDSGLYRIGDNRVALSVGGVGVVDVLGSVVNLSTNLQVSGNSGFTGRLTNETLTASRPVLSGTGKELVSGQIDLSSANHVTSILAATRTPTNTASQAGVVTPGVASKVWKTDGSGNPDWRDDATGAAGLTPWTSPIDADGFGLDEHGFMFGNSTNVGVITHPDIVVQGPGYVRAFATNDMMFHFVLPTAANKGTWMTIELVITNPTPPSITFSNSTAFVGNDLALVGGATNFFRALWTGSNVLVGSISARERVSDAAFNESTWNGDGTNAPSKNAVRDQLVTMPTFSNIAGSNYVNRSELNGSNYVNRTELNGSNYVNRTELNGSNYVVNTRTLTVAGTANQITSSAGALDLSANRTWTFSLPSTLIAPGNFTANIITNSGNTYLQADATVTGTAAVGALTVAETAIVTGQGSFGDHVTIVGEARAGAVVITNNATFLSANLTPTSQGTNFTADYGFGVRQYDMTNHFWLSAIANAPAANQYEAWGAILRNNSGGTLTVGVAATFKRAGTNNVSVANGQRVRLVLEPDMTGGTDLTNHLAQIIHYANP